jgi:hypothetical protein
VYERLDWAGELALNDRLAEICYFIIQLEIKEGGENDCV